MIPVPQFFSMVGVSMVGDTGIVQGQAAWQLWRLACRTSKGPPARKMVSFAVRGLYPVCLRVGHPPRYILQTDFIHFINSFFSRSLHGTIAPSKTS